MKLVKLDDYQSWLVEAGGVSVLVDPWLTEEIRLVARWFFRRGRAGAPPAVASLPRLDALLVSAHFVDHLDPATLSQLDRSIPVHTTAHAAKIIRALGFQDVRAHVAGERFEIGGAIGVETIAPAAFYAKTSLGFLLEDLGSHRRIYLETHGPDEAALTRLAGSIDALVTTCESVRMPFVALTMGPEQALRSIAIARPRYFVPTGIEPGRNAGLFAETLLRVRGTVADLRGLLATSGASTELVSLGAGEALEIAA